MSQNDQKQPQTLKEHREFYQMNGEFKTEIPDDIKRQLCKEFNIEYDDDDGDTPPTGPRR